jgi:hypothetical protein
MRAVTAPLVCRGQEALHFIWVRYSLLRSVRLVRRPGGTFPFLAIGALRERLGSSTT